MPPLVSYDLDKNAQIFKNNIKLLHNFLNAQRLLRGLDQIHIINKNRELLFSSSETGYLPVEEKAINMVLNDNKPLKIINAYENKSGAIIKIQSMNNAFLYIVKFFPYFFLSLIQLILQEYLICKIFLLILIILFRF